MRCDTESLFLLGFSDEEFLAALVMASSGAFFNKLLIGRLAAINNERIFRFPFHCQPMNKYVVLLGLLLQNANVSTFEYWGEFVLRCERDVKNPAPALEEMFGKTRIPPAFNVRLRNTWWIGDRKQWERLVQTFPLQGLRPPRPETPLQAATLVNAMFRTRIVALRVNESSDLTLELSDGKSLTVQGIGGEDEESWFLELPVDDPDVREWSIVCESSSGTIGGKFPTYTASTQ